MLGPLMASADYRWDAVEQFKWCFAEVNLAIAYASAPVLKPFFTRPFWSAKSSSLLRLPRCSAGQESEAGRILIADNDITSSETTQDTKTGMATILGESC